MLNPNLRAWAPTSDPQLLQISSVLVHQNQSQLDPSLYLNLLSNRIEMLLAASPNPEEALANLVSQMAEDALLEDDGKVEMEDAGEALVASNPLVRQRLSALNLLRSLSDPHEMPEARAVLQEDQKDPANRLLDWASALASR